MQIDRYGRLFLALKRKIYSHFYRGMFQEKL